MRTAGAVRGKQERSPYRRWTAEEDALVRALPPAEAARRTGRTSWAVALRRRKLRLPDGRKCRL